MTRRSRSPRDHDGILVQRPHLARSGGELDARRDLHRLAHGLGVRLPERVADRQPVSALAKRHRSTLVVRQEPVAQQGDDGVRPGEELHPVAVRRAEARQSERREHRVEGRHLEEEADLPRPVDERVRRDGLGSAVERVDAPVEERDGRDDGMEERPPADAAVRVRQPGAQEERGRVDRAARDDEPRGRHPHAPARRPVRRGVEDLGLDGRDALPARVEDEAHGATVGVHARALRAGVGQVRERHPPLCVGRAAHPAVARVKARHDVATKELRRDSRAFPRPRGGPRCSRSPPRRRPAGWRGGSRPRPSAGRNAPR